MNLYRRAVLRRMARRADPRDLGPMLRLGTGRVNEAALSARKAGRPDVGPVIDVDLVPDDRQDHTELPLDRSPVRSRRNGDRRMKMVRDRPEPRTSALPDRPVRQDGSRWDVERRPLLPPSLANPVASARTALSALGYEALFHLLRLHIYAARAVAWTPRGLARICVGVW